MNSACYFSEEEKQLSYRKLYEFKEFKNELTGFQCDNSFFSSYVEAFPENLRQNTEVSAVKML